MEYQYYKNELEHYIKENELKEEDLFGENLEDAKKHMANYCLRNRGRNSIDDVLKRNIELMNRYIMELRG